jgi:hypothetical protein
MDDKILKNIKDASLLLNILKGTKLNKITIVKEYAEFEFYNNKEKSILRWFNYRGEHFNSIIDIMGMPDYIDCVVENVHYIIYDRVYLGIWICNEHYGAEIDIIGDIGICISDIWRYFDRDYNLVSR